MSNTGPMTPPLSTAPTRHGASARRRPGSRARRASNHPLNTIPDPRYSTPASNTGGMSVTSSFATGVLAPNSAAAARAQAGPLSLNRFKDSHLRLLVAAMRDGDVKPIQFRHEQ